MSKKVRITVTVDEDFAQVLAAYKNAGLDPKDVLVAELRKFKKSRGTSPKKISPKVEVQ